MISTRQVTFVCTICGKTVTQQRYPGRFPSYCGETCEDEGRRKKTQERVKKLRARQKKRRPMTEQPHWHPIAMLATIARHIDGMVEADQEQLATLQEARTKPYVLDDDTVTRVKHAFTTQREDFWVFEEQLRSFQALQLTAKPRAEITRLQSQMARLRQINSDVLTQAEDLSKGKI